MVYSHRYICVQEKEKERKKKRIGIRKNRIKEQRETMKSLKFVSTIVIVFTENNELLRQFTKNI